MVKGVVKARDPIIRQNVDRPWFERELERVGLTLAALAARLPGSPHRSAVTLFLDGQRRIRLDEAVVLAALLGKPLEEIARRAGAYESQAPEKHRKSTRKLRRGS